MSGQIMDSGFMYVRGCRSPNSKGIGYWDGAFIFATKKYISEMVFGAFYINERDFIAHAPTKETIRNYNKLIEDGWIDMSLEDIQLTAGIDAILYELL